MFKGFQFIQERNCLLEQTQINIDVASSHWSVCWRKKRSRCRLTALGQVGICKIFRTGYGAITCTPPK